MVLEKLLSAFPDLENNGVGWGTWLIWHGKPLTVGQGIPLGFLSLGPLALCSPTCLRLEPKRRIKICCEPTQEAKKEAHLFDVWVSDVVKSAIMDRLTTRKWSEKWHYRWWVKKEQQKEKKSFVHISCKSTVKVCKTSAFFFFYKMELTLQKDKPNCIFALALFSPNRGTLHKIRFCGHTSAVSTDDKSV